MDLRGRPALAAFALVASLLSANGARAQTDAAEAEARAHFKKGNAHFDRQEWLEALGGVLAAAGACAISFPSLVCPTGMEECAGACTAVETDDHNCGTCGKVCAAYETCLSGRCTPPTRVNIPAPVDKIDLLFVVDNSRRSIDSDEVLGMAVPDLVNGLVNPKCVDPANPGDASKWYLPSGPTDACPDGTQREFAVVFDIHIGVITSSLGGHGSDACPDSETDSCAGSVPNTSNNDKGHLISRLDPCAGGSVPTYQDSGFLAWDPVQKDIPPGEPNLGEVSIDTTTLAPGLVPNLKDMVIGAGHVGCGYPSQMEAWYRFLVDPDPPESLTKDAQGDVVRVGLDGALLQQRAEFLRPDSLLAIVVVTSRNDGSINESGQFYVVAQQRIPNDPTDSFHLPAARAECATNPDDPCCLSCVQDAGSCPPDPTCTTLDAATDDPNLRLWHQKQRFGIDFLYPIDRYVTALTQPLVPDSAGGMVENPIFTNLNPSAYTTDRVRDRSLVFLAGIVGVPWQDIALDHTDLTKGFKTHAQMDVPDPAGHTTWDYIAGTSQNPVSTTDPKAPLDPHMYEDDKPRHGTDPITGDTLAPPSMTEGGPDAISGHEYTPGTINGVQNHPDDLEYACTFELPAPRDCSDPAQSYCDCADPLNDSPLCAPDPSNGGGRTLQRRAKATPSIRELMILKALGDQGIVGSICPAQLDDLGRSDFGYRPAIQGILDRLKLVLGPQCFPRPLTPDAEGQVSCLILEATDSGGANPGTDGHAYGGMCDAYCDLQAGRGRVTTAHRPAVQKALAHAPSQFDCACEIEQLQGPGCSSGSGDSPLAVCQCDPEAAPVYGDPPVPVVGWCYVDATNGIADLVNQCPADAQQRVRFVGADTPKPGSTVFILCAGGGPSLSMP